MFTRQYGHSDTNPDTFPDKFQKYIAALLFWINIIFITATCSSGASIKIDIISKNLSHRIVQLEEVETRLNLMVGFKVSGINTLKPEEVMTWGRLLFNNTEIKSVQIPRLDSFGGNLNFYLPFDISPGDYTLVIDLHTISTGNILASQKFSINNIETIAARETGSRDNWIHPEPIPLHPSPGETIRTKPTKADNKRGYILWTRNPFKYVYPTSVPKNSEIISTVSTRLAQNDYEPVTFSLYALKDINKVTIEITELIGQHDSTIAAPEIHTAETVPRITNRNSTYKSYELRPRLLLKKNQASLQSGRSQRFWLTAHTSTDTLPGKYEGHIIITSDSLKTKIPILVEVLPFALKERPDKEYGFMMTYEFQEMTALDLSGQERQKIYENGLKYYRSYKEHGITTIFPHSSFTFKRRSNGHPDLRDLGASLKAFNDVGFSGPFIYYCGHLVQNSKPGWAGSTLGFDPERHPALMKEIISYARENFIEMQSVDFYWMVGDEIQENLDGPDRMTITESLLKPVWDLQGKTAITTWNDISWPVDIQFGSPNPSAGEYWSYPNNLTTVPDKVDDAESIRRAFGLSHVNSPFIGIAPWTFQTSGNASGDPYSDSDNNGRAEVMIAYPGTDGPITTPEYEAVREGIDDGRYAYMLETLIKEAKVAGSSSHKKLRHQAEMAYRRILNRADSSTLEEMDANRKIMIDWILQLSELNI